MGQVQAKSYAQPFAFHATMGGKPLTKIKRNRSGSLLRHLRRTQGITQASLARDLGVSRGAIAQWETGRASYKKRIELLRKRLASLRKIS